MRLSYDAAADAAYLYLADEIESVEYTVPCDPREVAGMINLDFTTEDRVQGIEFISASQYFERALLLAVAQGSSGNLAPDIRGIYMPSTDVARIYLNTHLAYEIVRTYACDPVDVGGTIRFLFDQLGLARAIEVIPASLLLPEAFFRDITV